MDGVFKEVSGGLVGNNEPSLEEVVLDLCMIGVYDEGGKECNGGSYKDGGKGNQ